jgi:hypothetical protein
MNLDRTKGDRTRKRAIAQKSFLQMDTFNEARSDFFFCLTFIRDFLTKQVIKAVEIHVSI